MYHITKAESEEKRAAMKSIKDVNANKRLQAVALRGEGKKNAEIGKITGFHEDMVGKYSKKHIEMGIAGLIEDGRIGGNNRNMSEEEARKLLSGFEERAEAGEIITVKDIGAAYDEAVGKTHES